MGMGNRGSAQFWGEHGSAGRESLKGHLCDILETWGGAGTQEFMGFTLRLLADGNMKIEKATSCSQVGRRGTPTYPQNHPFKMCPAHNMYRNLKGGVRE